MAVKLKMSPTTMFIKIEEMVIYSLNGSLAIGANRLMLLLKLKNIYSRKTNSPAKEIARPAKK